MEFAFVVPVVLAMMFAVVDFGRALYTYHFVSSAAREATRWASVRGKECTDYPKACPASAADVQEYVESITPTGIDGSAARLSVGTSWLLPPGDPGKCPTDPKTPGCAVQVQVQYKFRFLFPFLPSQTYTMTSSSQMIISR